MTRFHYNLKQWVGQLDKEIARASYLCTTYPEDPRYEETLSALNIYEKLRNYITGSDDCVPLVPDYDYMVQCWKESQSLNKKGLKGFQKIETAESVESAEDEVPLIAQTVQPDIPEVEKVVEVKKKKKKEAKV